MTIPPGSLSGSSQLLRLTKASSRCQERQPPRSRCGGGGATRQRCSPHTLGCDPTPCCDGETQILLQETQSRWWVPIPNRHPSMRRCTLTIFVTKRSTQATKKAEPNPRSDFYPNMVRFPTDLSEALAFRAVSTGQIFTQRSRDTMRAHHAKAKQQPGALRSGGRSFFFSPGTAEQEHRARTMRKGQENSSNKQLPKHSPRRWTGLMDGIAALLMWKPSAPPCFQARYRNTTII